MKDRIEISNDYLIIAFNPKGGYFHAFSERAFLVHNLQNFQQEHPNVHASDISIYELREINKWRGIAPSRAPGTVSGASASAGSGIVSDLKSAS